MSFTIINKRPAYSMLENGYITSCGATRKNLVASLAYVPEAGDIFIVTYPKCGTTWTQNILFLMKNKGEPLQPGQNVNDFIPHLESDGRDVVEKLPPPRIIKTHLPFHLTPKSPQAKYIYIARNPKDCCVSAFHHTKGFKGYNFEDGTFDEYFELFLEGKVDHGDYFDNLLSWFEHKDDCNVLFLLYEEIKMETAQCFKKIGNFLGGCFKTTVEDSASLKDILKYSSFDIMKISPSLWSSEREPQFAPFIRKGEIGDWKNYFSNEQSRKLDEKFKTKLSGTQAEFLWKQYDLGY